MCRETGRTGLLTATLEVTSQKAYPWFPWRERGRGLPLDISHGPPAKHNRVRSSRLIPPQTRSESPLVTGPYPFNTGSLIDVCLNLLVNLLNLYKKTKHERYATLKPLIQDDCKISHTSLNTLYLDYMDYMQSS